MAPPLHNTLAIALAGAGITHTHTEEKTMRARVCSALAVVLSTIPALGAFAQPLSFSRTDFASRRGARTMVTGDFNRDGWPDVAHAGSGDDNLTVLLNGRDGELIDSYRIPVGVGAFDMAAADFDRDGITDVAVVNADSDTISILRGRGDGRFTRSDIGAHRGPRGIASADMDGDGRLDLVHTAWDGAAIVVMLGDGAGGFTTRWAMGYAANPQGVGIADFNRDGHPDVAVANNAPEGLIIWHGPAQSFTPAVIPGESYLNVLAIGDLNGDGRPDVAAAAADRGRVAIYLGTASGLVFARSYRVDGDPRGITIADVNVDGVPDVMVASRSTSSVTVLPGDPAHRGSFLPRLTFAAGPGARAVAAADFNGDGKPDLAIGAQYAASVSLLSNDTPMLRAAYSFDRLTLPAGADLDRYRASLSSGRGFAAADFDRDGTLDFAQRVANTSSLAVVLRGGNTVILRGLAPYAGHVVDDFNADGNPDVLSFASGAFLPGTQLLTFLGNGRGEFTRSAVTVAGTPLLTACASGDLNRDRKPDLVCVEERDTGSMYVLLANGNGTFRVPSAPTGGHGMDPQIADINRDGRLDVVLALSGEIWLGNGDGSLRQGPSVQVGFDAGWRVAVAELNRDGYADLVFSYNGESLFVSLGGPAGYLESGPVELSCECDFSFVVADVTMDGIQDIVVNPVEATELAGTLFVLPGRGDGSFGTAEPAWPDAETFTLPPGEPLVADVTGDGLPDVIVPGSGEVHVLVNQRNETNRPPVIVAPPVRRTTDLIALAGNYGCLTLPFAPPYDPDQHAVFVEFEVQSPPLSPAYVYPNSFMRAIEEVTICVEGSGTQTVAMTVRDNRGGQASGTFAVITVTGPREIVLHMDRASSEGGRWTLIHDDAAASGVRIYDPNAGAAKVPAPRWPTPFVAIEFVADPALAYKLWVRLKADGNSWANDSVWVQFSSSSDATGRPAYRVGTTSGLPINLEECLHCGVAGWGWEDDGWGAVDRNGALVRFPDGARQRIFIQSREDGVSIDQIVLSAERYLTTRPGTAKNDRTIVPKTQ